MIERALLPRDSVLLESSQSAVNRETAVMCPIVLLPLVDREQSTVRCH